VYVPVFVNGRSENGSNLRILVWIRNDRNSNQRFIESGRDLDRFVEEFNRHPQPVSGVLRQPTGVVRKLATEAYPGAPAGSLQVLWARDFPKLQLVNLLWGLMAVFFLGAGLCAVAYRRLSRSIRDGRGAPS